MKHTIRTRFWVMLLAFAMIFSMLPVSAFAVDADLVINNLDDLKAFAEEVNGGNKYDGKTILLNADITGMNMVIGLDGTSVKDFKGTFDGNGHTITVAISGNANQALFAKNAAGGTIKNLIVAGSVSGTSPVAGICAQNYGTIESCANYATISARGSYSGGITGQNNSNGSILNCVNYGAVTTTSTNNAGGITGNNQGTMTNCYNVGVITGTKAAGLFNYGNANNVTNCYYLSDGTTSKGTAKTDAEMKTAEFASTLGDAFKYVDGKYPELTFGKGGGSVTPPADEKVTVAFMNGTETYHTVEVEEGATVTAPATPTKEGYSFKHWSNSENGEAFDFTTAITTDTTLYAVWEETPETADECYLVVNLKSDNVDKRNAHFKVPYGKTLNITWQFVYDADGIPEGWQMLVNDSVPTEGAVIDGIKVAAIGSEIAVCQVAKPDDLTFTPSEDDCKAEKVTKDLDLTTLTDEQLEFEIVFKEKDTEKYVGTYEMDGKGYHAANIYGKFEIDAYQWKVMSDYVLNNFSGYRIYQGRGDGSSETIDKQKHVIIVDKDGVAPNTSITMYVEVNHNTMTPLHVQPIKFVCNGETVLETTAPLTNAYVQTYLDIELDMTAAAAELRARGYTMDTSKTYSVKCNNYVHDPAVTEIEVVKSGNPSTPEVSGYTVTMPADTTAVAGEIVSIPVVIDNKDGSAYNAFDISFTYDASKLELPENYEIADMTVEVKNGTVRVLRYGEDLNVGSAAFTLTFKAIGTGETTVTATSAKVGVAATATELDAADATILDADTVITIGGYSVTLPDDFTGDRVVAPGADYTFTAKDKNYNYTVSATMGGQPVEVKDNVDGTFTIENVSGNLVITFTKEGKTFGVTLGEDMTAASTQAQYMTPYIATLNKKDGFTYDLEVTIGGNDYTGFEYSEETGVVTIPGAAITGAIEFNSNKTKVQPSEYTVSFEGNGAGDAVGENKVAAGADYSFTLNKAEGCTYTVSYKMGDSTESVALTEADGKFTIAKVSGNLVITVEKESDLAVEVGAYVELDGKTVFLVRATGTLADGKAYTYNGDTMYYSNVYKAWSWLVIVEEGNTFTADDAKAMITAVEAEYTTLDQTFDVNMTDKVDVNDAQLVYNFYNCEYNDFSVAPMLKFLNADVNGDKVVDTLDAAAVVNAVIDGTN